LVRPLASTDDRSIWRPGGIMIVSQALIDFRKHFCAKGDATQFGAKLTPESQECAVRFVAVSPFT
jgi:hypothetical protein